MSPTCLSAARLVSLLRARDGVPVWVSGERQICGREFAAEIDWRRGTAAEAGVSAGMLIVLPAEPLWRAVAWMLALAGRGAIIAPLRHERLAEAHAWGGFVRLHGSVEGDAVVLATDGLDSPVSAHLRARLCWGARPGLVLATGGTTGAPKVVLHDFDTLLGGIAEHTTARPRRLLPLMRLDHIGGVDMVVRALAAGHPLVEPPPSLDPESIAATIAAQRVAVLPATPSFLNLLLLSGAHLRHDLGSLETVPYGAEAMPPSLLARLQAAFPRVRFSERFGTSETGGLPVDAAEGGLRLRPDAAGYSWKVIAGELWVKAPTRALGYLSGGFDALDEPGWFRTGDLAEEASAGVVRIVGRVGSVINVGGTKVLPSVVENALLSHPDVRDCRVLGRPSALLGEMVVADLVWSGAERDPVRVKRILHDFAVSLLPKSHLPAAVRLVGAIDTTSNLKKGRRPCVESDSSSSGQGDSGARS